MTRADRIRGLLLALLPLGACEPGARSLSLETPDSAGVEIVENSWIPGTPRGVFARVEMQPTVVIGGAAAPSEQQIGNNINARRLPNDRIVVTDQTANRILVFSGTGTQLHATGRTGGGPGEYRFIWWVRPWQGDSIIVFDAGQLRFSILDSAARFARSFAVQRSPDHPRSLMLDTFGDGTFVGSANRFTPPPEVGRVSHGTAELLRFRPEAAPSFLGVTIHVHNYIERRGQGFLSIPVPFSVTTLWSVGDTLLYAAEADKYEIRQISYSGQLLRLMRLSMPSQAATRQQRTEARQRLATRSSNPTIRQTVARALRSMPIPDRLPLLGRPAWERVPTSEPERRSMVVDGVGFIWVLEYSLTGDQHGRLWGVFDPDGQFRGTVLLPPPLEPFQIGSDYVLGWRQDSLDAVQVVLHHLDRGAK